MIVISQRIFRIKSKEFNTQSHSLDNLIYLLNKTKWAYWASDEIKISPCTKLLHSILFWNTEIMDYTLFWFKTQSSTYALVSVSGLSYFINIDEHLQRNRGRCCPMQARLSENFPISPFNIEIYVIEYFRAHSFVWCTLHQLKEYCSW